MTNALALPTSKQIVLTEELKQRAIDMFFKGVPQDVLETVWLWSERYSLDIFAGHVVVLRFKDGKASKAAGRDVYNYTPYVTRDGALAHANQSGLLVSYQVFFGVQMATGREYCEVFVYRRDSNIPFRMTLFMDEWKPKGEQLDWDKNAFWRSKPSMMLQKTAIRQSVLQAIPLTIPVLTEDSSYFDTVMRSKGPLVDVSPIELPTPKEEPKQIEPPMYPASSLMDMVADPVDETPTVIENQPPSAPVDDPDALEKARADVHTLGEDALGVAKWKTMKLPLIRSVKATAESLEDLNLEELAKLTTALIAKKLGAGGERRM